MKNGRNTSASSIYIYMLSVPSRSIADFLLSQVSSRWKGKRAGESEEEEEKNENKTIADVWAALGSK